MAIKFTNHRNLTTGSYSVIATWTDVESVFAKELPAQIFRGIVDEITKVFLEKHLDTLIENLDMQELQKAVADKIADAVAQKALSNLLK